ncbi:MDR/zinc-dependent alcohol dehydrogenase-like family protein [Planctomyces sp. SH-PL14]|uniref:MDR/zinc-dependent alcohol dehydrogenase-like family protein n=1 Tax=Planctomyces sp. SH-PL14 TaxID=1632864 RepID=UPI00078C2A44|nr:alcohol dehydrogenase catalytic domain-containing protein [Planctomyces sp. SH-PL14]AMV17921.1 D-arabitol-phosphate dehydrogenase [Planctomyces sp. SH-PL14]
MRALILEAGGQVRYAAEHTGRDPRPSEIPIRVLRAGVCETDLQLARGYMGFQGILGHEFVGIAESGKFAGRRVAGEINCSCHRCDLCRQGLSNHCPNRSVIGILDHDGAFADRVFVPERNLHLIPDSVSDDEAVFIEPLAAAFQIPAQLDLKPVRSAVVLGDGRLGNLCAQVLHRAGCRVTAVGKHEWKLQRLADAGVDTCLLDALPIKREADLVVDCTGSSGGVETALRLLRPRGTLVLKTTTAAPHGPNLAAVVIDEITVVGSRCGPFDKAIEALADRDIDVRPLITARFPLEEGEEAMRAAARPENLKVLLQVSN